MDSLRLLLHYLNINLAPPPPSKHRDFPYHRGNGYRQEIGCSSKTGKSNLKSSPTHQNTNKTSKTYMDHHPSDTKREITPQLWNSGSRKRSATHWSTWNYIEQNHIKTNTTLKPWEGGVYLTPFLLNPGQSDTSNVNTSQLWKGGYRHRKAA